MKDLPPNIQFHDKLMDNRDWYEMVGPEGSGAPLVVRQSGYVLDAHPKDGGHVIQVFRNMRGKNLFIRLETVRFKLAMRQSINKKL